MCQDILTSPLMEVSAGTTQSLIREGECKGRSLEGLALPEMILRILLIDAGEK